MPRYKLTIEYDGTHFFGWQVQPDTRTVEGEIEKAIFQILQQEVDIVGQGRTDAGVHASKQVAHLDLGKDVAPDKFIHSINRITPNDVYIHSIEPVHEEFHARFDATSRMYEYRMLKQSSPLKQRTAIVLPRSCSIERMKSAASLLIGEFDFAELSKKNDEILNTTCTILTSVFEEDGDLLIYRIQANRFLRNMVRRIVGVLITIGEEKMTIEDLKGLLDHTKPVPVKTAPAHGLILTNVLY